MTFIFDVNGRQFEFEADEWGHDLETDVYDLFLTEAQAKLLCLKLLNASFGTSKPLKDEATDE